MLLEKEKMLVTSIFSFSNTVFPTLFFPTYDNKMVVFVFDREENVVGKGENAGYQHFLLFQHCFQKASFTGLLKFGIVW